jgi:hypothetical protein
MMKDFQRKAARVGEAVEKDYEEVDISIKIESNIDGGKR